MTQDVTLQQLLGAEGVEPPRPPPSLHEAQIAELALLLARYGRCPYKVGDWVTPRQNSCFDLAGEPHVVVEVLADPRIVWNDSHPYTSVNGRFDMRVARVNPTGDLTMFWVEACWFDKYVEPPGGRPEH